MKYIWIAVAIILAGAVAIFFWYEMTRTPSVSCASLVPAPVVVAFGDSLVVGFGAPDGQGFVDDLVRSSSIPIANLGVAGDTTADGLGRIDSILNRKPDIAIMLLGGNDALRKVPQSITQSNLDHLLSTLESAHIKVVLVGVQGALLSDPYAPMYRTLANKYKTEYVPNILSGIIGHTDLMSDEVHPNAAGYQKIAERIQPALERACAK